MLDATGCVAHPLSSPCRPSPLLTFHYPDFRRHQPIEKVEQAVDNPLHTQRYRQNAGYGHLALAKQGLFLVHLHNVGCCGDGAFKQASVMHFTTPPAQSPPMLPKRPLPAVG